MVLQLTKIIPSDKINAQVIELAHIFFDMMKERHIMDNRPIGFFDSGLGGLTCIPFLHRELPKEKIVYYGDTARTPYGSKSIENIRRFSIQIVEYLMSHDVKLIVIACNTVSATCLDTLRERFPQIPIVGIINPMAKYISKEYEKGDKYGVIGTKVTINSGVYEETVKGLNDNINIKSLACPALVPLIEEGIVKNEIMDLTVKYYLDDFIRINGINKLVLGCTHYPIIKENLKRIYPDVKLLNPSEAVVYRVKDILIKENMLAENNDRENLCYASDLSENFLNMINLFFDKDKVDTNIMKFDD